MPGARPAQWVFVDTNVFLYAVADDEPAKQATCLEWLDALWQHDAGISSLQVANEFASVVYRRHPALARTEVHRLTDAVLEWGTDPINLHTVHAAREIHLATNFAWWDCLLLAAAVGLGCTHFLSEDLSGTAGASGA